MDTNTSTRRIVGPSTATLTKQYGKTNKYSLERKRSRMDHASYKRAKTLKKYSKLASKEGINSDRVFQKEYDNDNNSDQNKNNESIQSLYNDNIDDDDESNKRRKKKDKIKKPKKLNPFTKALEIAAEKKAAATIREAEYQARAKEKEIKLAERERKRKAIKKRNMQGNKSRNVSKEKMLKLLDKVKAVKGAS